MINSSLLKPTAKGTLLFARVHASAVRFEIQRPGAAAQALPVRVPAPPVKGKANKELVSGLKKALSASVQLVGGAGSRHKTLLVSAPVEEVHERLKRALEDKD